MSAHTPEPWAIDPDDRPGMEWNNHIVAANSPGMTICFMSHDGTDENIECQANARRIVACVNACKRFRIETLEAAAACGGITEDPTASQIQAEKQRDELQQKWDYYQNFVKAHGAESITELVVQRDELLEAMKMIEHATEPSHDDGAYHENAYSLAVDAIAKVKR